MTPLSSEKRNVLLLSSAQALFQTVSVMVITLSGLTGLSLAADKTLATLPVAMMMVSAAMIMIPASIFMKRFGRQRGFLLGTALGCIAGLTAATAIWMQDFWLFIFANMLVGGYQGFAQYYRFAAADVASPDFKSRAISWVIAGGVVAALAGPNIARYTRDLGEVPFMASYIALSILSLIALYVVTRITIPPIQIKHSDAPARPLPAIMRQPVFITALICSSVGFSMMAMVMTATPLAMQVCGHSLGDATTVIQWHVLGMFLPSFFTGNLIRRFGVLTILALGIALIASHVVMALSGIEFLHFISGLILLGVGWNFMFIGGTTLLTEAYRPSEQSKAQAAHDFLMFTAISIGSFSAGSLLNSFGWESVNFAVLPFLGIAAAAVIWLSILIRRRS